MEPQFDFDNIKKRMPYRLPEGTFDRIEARVAEALKADVLENEASKNDALKAGYVIAEKSKPRKTWFLRWRPVAGIAVAASIALLMVFTPRDLPESEQLRQIDTVYAELSEADRNNLLEIYDEDIYINQE